MEILNRLERKWRRFAVPNLMYYITGGMLLVFLFDLLIPSAGVSSYLMLDMGLVAKGEVWRLVTFIFMPPDTSIIFVFISLYFYVMIGNGLENQWGAFKFNVFYLVGVVGAILAALITGFGINTYLNLSMFLAFAAIYPNFELLVFFVLPVKIKYLAYLDVALFVWQLIVGSWSDRAAILLSLINIALFFGGDLIRHFKMEAGYSKTRRNFRRNMWR